MSQFKYFGTVSHGTLNTADLIERFATVLYDISPWARDTYFHNETPEDLNDPEFLAGLIDVLDAYAPDGFYFGAHQGDGSDFGFWSHTD